jgi:hypothetical protein
MGPFSSLVLIFGRQFMPFSFADFQNLVGAGSANAHIFPCESELAESSNGLNESALSDENSPWFAIKKLELGTRQRLSQYFIIPKVVR